MLLGKLTIMDLTFSALDDTMGFDEFTSSQDFRMPSPPLVRHSDIVWKMPEPSNPGLRILWSNADDDAKPSTRGNPRPSQSEWNFSSTDVQDQAPLEDCTANTSSSRVAARNRTRQSTSSSHTISMEAFSKLTDADFMNRVRMDADDRAARRAEELSKARSKSRKSSSAKRKGSIYTEASSKGSDRVSKMAGDKMTRARAIRADYKGKGKECLRSFSDATTASMDIDHESTHASVNPFVRRNDSPGNISTVSSSSSSVLKTPEDANMMTSFSKDDSFMNIDVPDTTPSPSPLPVAFGPKALKAPQGSIASASKARPQPRKSSSSTAAEASPAFKYHPLLIQQEEERQKLQQEKQKQSRLHSQDISSNNVLPQTQLRVASTSGATGCTSAAQPISPSLPRPSGRPPPLGMRRAATFPATKANNSSDQGSSTKELPMRQRGFRPPLLSSAYSNSSQVPSATVPAVDTAACTRKGKTLVGASASSSKTHTVPSLIPEAHSPRKPAKIPHPSSDGPEGGEADSSYGDISFDLDALEETMKKYD